MGPAIRLFTMKTALLSLLLASALSLNLAACSDDSSDPAPVNAGGAPGSVPARAQSCATIDKGALALLDEARKQAASSGATDATADTSAPAFCDTYFAGCSDEDVALAAPQFECFASHSQSSSEEVAKACPAATLSASCEASLDQLKPPAEKAVCAGYFSCVFDHYKGSPSALISCLWEWYYVC